MTSLPYNFQVFTRPPRRAVLCFLGIPYTVFSERHTFIAKDLAEPGGVKESVAM